MYVQVLRTFSDIGAPAIAPSLTVAMIRHSMDVIKSAVEHLNVGQTPVITFDQPLYALAKQIQWKWSEKYGEDTLVST